MAVNKNFVIKNGIQVNENLLYGDPDQTRVSIGTYVPEHTLHVIGGIGATHTHVTGISTFDRNLYIGGGLEVVGVTSLSSAGGMTTTGGSLRIGRGLFVQDGAQITGVTTVNNNADFNRNLDVFLQTKTQFLHCTGIGTISGVGSFGSNVDIDGILTVNEIVLDGGTTIGTDIDTRNLRVTGLSTFVGFVDINNSVDINNDLLVTGVSTFSSDLDINASVDIDGHTELDNLNVSGVSTFVGLSTFQNGIYVTGVGTFVNDLDIDASVDIDGHTELDNLNVSGVSTFASTNVSGVSSISHLIVTGLSTFIGISSFQNGMRVTGVSTFLNPLDIDASVDIDGHTELDNLNVSGVSTFASEVDINNQVHVSGATTFNSAITVNGSSDLFTTTIGGFLDINNDMDVSGVSTFQKVVTLDEGIVVVGVSTFSDNLDINASVDIDGHTELDNLNVSGVSTFVGLTTYHNGIFVTGVATFAQNVDIDGSIDIDGHLEVDNLRASGVSTFIGNIDADGNLDVDGHTELDDLNVSGVSTFSNNIDANGNLDVDGRTELDITNISETLNVVGVSTFASDIDINASIDVDGRTELDTTNISETLNVSGISTFASDIDINASIDVDGHTELDDLNVTGVATFANNIDANGNLDVDGHTELDNLNVSGVSTFTSDVDINASVDIDGHTELDDLNVSGVSTFSNNIDANGDLDVSGRTELDTTNISERLNVVGIATFASDIDINASIDVDGHTELDNLNVSGVSTFASDIDINASIDVDGHTELDDLNVTGVTTFNNQLIGTNANFTGVVTAAQFVGFGSFIDGIVAIGTRPHEVGSGINTAPGDLWWNAETGIGYVYYHDPSGDEFWVDFSGQSGGPTSGSINDLIRDTSPQLGGNLDLNGRNITGTGNIDITGNINFTGSISGTGITASQVLVDVNPGTATSHQILVSAGATLDNIYSISADTNFYYTPSTDTLNTVDVVSRNITAGIITATALHGDGSNITGLATTESVNARFLNAGITTISQLRATGVTTFMGPVGIGTFDEEIIDINNEFTLTTKGKLRVVGTNPYQPDSLTVVLFGTAAYNQTYVRNGSIRGQVDEATNTFNVDGSLYPWSTYYYDAGGGNFYVIGRDDTVWKIFTTTINPSTFVDGTSLSMTNVGALASASITKDGFESPDVADPNVTYSGSTPVGIGTTISLDGNTGIVSATAFYGDGSNLTGIAATDNTSTNTLVVTGVSTLGIVTSSSNYIVGVSTIDASAGHPYKGLDVLTDRGNINIGINTDKKRVAFTGTGNTTVTSEIIDNGFGTLGLDRPTNGFVRISINDKLHLFAAENSYTKLYHDGNQSVETTSTGVLLSGIATANNFVGLSSITATSFYGDGANLTGIANTGDINADRITVVGVVTAATFIGDGSGLSNLTGIGTGVFIQDDDTNIGAATTINFGEYISVTPIVAGITTIVGMGTENVTSNTLVAGIATITTLKVGTAITATNGIITATSFVGDGSNLTGIADTSYILAQTLNVTGVSTLGIVTGATYFGDGSNLSGISTQSVNAQFLNSGITTARQLNIQGTQVFDYSTLTLSGFVPSSFDGEYTRQATGFTLDTGSVSSGNALFHADSNYYYYSKVGAASTAIVFSNEDNSGNGQWLVFYKSGSDFTEGNISNNDALGSVDASSGVAFTSFQYDNSRESIPGASDIVYNSSFNIGIATLGIATANHLYVAGVVTATSFVGDGSNLTGISGVSTANVSTNNLVVAGVSTFIGVIEASSGENKIPFLYSNLASLPDPGSYHGMFAHVHSEGKGYFAHAGNWIELVNKETNGVTGTGVENYNVGVVTATSFSGSLAASNLTGALPALDGSALTNITAAGSGVVVRHDDALVGTAATINFGTNLDVSAISAGIVTVTASGGGSGLGSRQTFNAATSGSHANSTAENITITAYKGYALYKITVSQPAWVTLYVSTATRTADAGRLITQDPTPGSGVIAEVITSTANETVLFTPALMGYNDDSVPSTNVYAKVVNRSGSTQSIDTELTVTQLEA